VFSIKRNLFFMNNFYRKVAVASVGIALGFTLEANKEAKAAIFTLTDPEVFFIEGYENEPAYNTLLGSGSDLGFETFSVEKIYDGYDGSSDYERRAFYEFDIGNLSLAPDTVIRRAILKTPLTNTRANYRYLDLGLFGYVGNGSADLSDFDAGVRLGTGVAVDNYSYPSITYNNIDFDVTPFVNERVNSRDDFAGFGIRVEEFYFNYGAATLRRYYSPPSLIIETADATVPEPTTIFGSAIGLCLGGWLKRKRSNQQKKTIP
jgi:hypothetical protein